MHARINCLALWATPLTTRDCRPCVRTDHANAVISICWCHSITNTNKISQTHCANGNANDCNIEYILHTNIRPPQSILHILRWAPYPNYFLVHAYLLISSSYFPIGTVYWIWQSVLHVLSYFPTGYGPWPHCLNPTFITRILLSDLAFTLPATSLSTSKLGEDFMKIPRLDIAGTNWVIYKDCFLWAIDACATDTLIMLTALWRNWLTPTWDVRTRWRLSQLQKLLLS